MDIQFLGAAGEVTGSCHLLRVNGRRILLECGLIQGTRQAEARNAQPFPFKAGEIDAVILSHAHIDHSGRLPLLYKSGFRGPVYTHGATRDLCSIMLRDSAYLMEKDAEWDNRKRQRKGLEMVQPLYTRRDAERAVELFAPLDYDREIEVVPGVRLRLRDAGHILGSAIVELWLEEKGVRRKVVFSGDLGHRGAPILRDPVQVNDADLVLMESTYGNRRHRSWEATWQELGEILEKTRRDEGNILIPAFAVGRTQELLYLFGLNYEQWGLERWDVFLDSPLAIEATEIHARHTELYDREAARENHINGSLFALPNLHISRTAAQSMRLNRISAGAIIIAGSGMCNGGRIKHHLKHNLWRRNCHVVMIGFQAAGTLGRQLVDGATHIRLWGETIRVGAEVHTVGGLSAHADQEGLLDWYRGFRGHPPVVLVHGEPEAREQLEARLETECAGAQVFRPEPGERLDLTHLPVR